MCPQHAQAALAGKLQFGNLNQLEALENMAAAESCVKLIVESLDAMQDDAIFEFPRAPETAKDAYYICFQADAEDELLSAFDLLTGGLDWQLAAADPTQWAVAAEWQRWIVAEAKRRWEGR